MIAPKPIKHRFSILLLVLSYTVGTMGLFTSYYTFYHRQAFQSEIRKAPASSLERMTFTQTEFNTIRWFESRKEFEWKGKMYDVSSISMDGDGFVILCKNDSVEEMLLSLIDFTKGGHPQSAKKGIPQPQFFAQDQDLGAEFTLDRKERSLWAWYSFYLSVAPQISSPPPRS